jgi:Mce-associated membrane protein
VSERTQDEHAVDRADGTPGGTSAGPATTRTAVLAVVGTLVTLALIGLVVALAVLWVRYDDLKDQRDDHAADLEEARGVAYDAALDMSTWDHRTVDADFAWVQEYGTEEFQSVMDEETLAQTKSVIRETRQRAEAEVVRIAAERNEDGTITVLAFVNQRVTVGSQEPAAEGIRLEMEMVEEDGEWRLQEASPYH